MQSVVGLHMGMSRRPLVSIAVTAMLLLGTGILVFAVSPAANTPTAVVADLASTYDPVATGERLPEGYRVGFPRDQIAPVYEPSFTDAAAVDWPDDSLVIGVAGAETAKAYPVTHLNSREMVIDSLDGIPILVSW